MYGYNHVMNLEKGHLDKLNMIVHYALLRQGFHGRQASDDRLYSRRKEKMVAED